MSLLRLLHHNRQLDTCKTSLGDNQVRPIHRDSSTRVGWDHSGQALHKAVREFRVRGLARRCCRALEHLPIANTRLSAMQLVHKVNRSEGLGGRRDQPADRRLLRGTSR